MESVYESFDLTPEQIIKVNKIKHLSLNPAYGGKLLIPLDVREAAIVKCNGMKIKLSIAEAFRL